jgi:hypothetical protein
VLSNQILSCTSPSWYPLPNFPVRHEVFCCSGEHEPDCISGLGPVDIAAPVASPLAEPSVVAGAAGADAAAPAGYSSALDYLVAQNKSHFIKAL